MRDGQLEGCVGSAQQVDGFRAVRLSVPGRPGRGWRASGGPGEPARDAGPPVSAVRQESSFVWEEGWSQVVGLAGGWRQDRERGGAGGRVGLFTTVDREGETLAGGVLGANRRSGEALLRHFAQR